MMSTRRHSNIWRCMHRAAARATYVAFIASGFAFASWAARIPQVRDGLELSSAQLGLVLLAIAAGSLIALPLAGTMVARLGSARTVAAMAVLLGIGLVVVALGFLVGVVPVLVGLFLFGFSNGAWDVAMNVQGAAVERGLGRAIMPRFHAGFSVGTVAGALLGAAMVALRVPVSAHLAVVAVACAVVMPLAVRAFLPDADEPGPGATGDGPGGGASGSAARTALARWREPRTLLIGVVVMSFALAEGAGNDWITVALIDGFGASAELGTIGFAVFLAAMTTCRWFGPHLLERFGRVASLRALAATAVVGLLLFGLSSSTPVALAGTVLWGLGVALGFPVGMSAAADEPEAAAARVSVVSSIGYCAFLAGPPVIGLVGEHVTVPRALLLVAGLLVLTCLIVGAARPPRGGVATSPPGALADPPAA